MRGRPDQPVGEHRERQDVDAGPVRNEIAPMRPAGARERRDRDLEILGAVGVGVDEQHRLAAIGGMMIDIVEQRSLARRHQHGQRVGGAQIDQAGFRCLVVVGRDLGEMSRLQFRDRDEVAWIGRLVDEHVVGRGSAEAMAKHARRAVLRVEPHVVERRRIRGPHRGARHVGHQIRQVDTGGEIAHTGGVELGPGLIGRPHQETMVGRVSDAAELEEGLAGRERVAVEQHLVGAAAAGRAAEQRMLSALAVAAKIGIGPVRRRDRGVILLDPPLHLGEQRVLQRAGAGHHRLGMGVLGLEICADAGIERARIAHHGLPVRRFEPRIVVGQRDAVARRGDGPLLGARDLLRVDVVERGGVRHAVTSRGHRTAARR
jgi:hypothetical protein